MDLEAMESVVELNEQLFVIARERDQLKRNLVYSQEQHVGEVLSLQRQIRRLKSRNVQLWIVLVIAILVLLSFL